MMGFVPACLAFLSLAAATACGPQAAPYKTDAARAELKGPVREVITDFRGNEKDAAGHFDTRRLRIERYDREGWLTDDELYTTDFIKKRVPKRIDARATYFHSVMGDSTERYRIDANGNLIETQIRYGGRSNGAPDETIRTKYDGQGRKSEDDTIFQNSKLAGVSIYRRDALGNIVEENRWVNDPGRPHAISHYSYDFGAHGNWIRRYQRRTGVGADSYDYGEAGTLIRTITYYADAQ
ncbi:MAG TPA: hypothetical protein VGL35_09055 [Rhizomicrobium sp.]|jgi:hypothetical protein